jgi:hypothetical protein
MTTKRGSSGANTALADPVRASNGNLVVLVGVLGALSIAVLVIKQGVPVQEVASARPVEETHDAPSPRVTPRVVAPNPTKPTRVIAPPKKNPIAAPGTGDSKKPVSAKPEDEAPADAEEKVPGPVAQEPGPPPEMASPSPRAEGVPTPAPATLGSVDDSAAVAEGVGSPLDAPARAPDKPHPGEAIEKFPDGSIKARYQVDAKGQKNGNYLENHPNGKLRIKATYKNDQLNGVVTECDTAGKIVKKASYKAGKLHGDLVMADATGKIATQETWLEGRLLYPKSTDLIERTLSEIAHAPAAGPAGPSKLAEFEPFAADAQIHALKRLQAYRYLCDVPYDVTLNREYAELCTAASRLLEIIGHLDHFPPRPEGCPDSLYIPACQGLANGNLHTHSARTGEALIMGGVDGWIWDSDRPKNIVEVGHRRQSLNPRMKQVAYGAKGNFTVMYSHDATREAHAREFVAYPSRGYFPISYLMKEAVWSCAFDSDRYRMADDAKVVVCFADDNYKKGDVVELHDVTVENKKGFAEGSAMIFRPDVVVSVGARYWVTITGVTDLEGKPVSVEYLVEFMRG